MCDLSNQEVAQVYVATWRKARKEHRCESCRSTIAPGQRYCVDFSVYDGSADTAKICAACWKDREAFADAHRFTPWPSAFEEALEECIQEDDESERRWTPVLEALLSRKQEGRHE